MSVTQKVYENSVSSTLLFTNKKETFLFIPFTFHQFLSKIDILHLKM